MTTTAPLGRSAEKALYLGGLALLGACGVAAAVCALLGASTAAVALLGLAVAAVAVVLPVHERRTRRFLSVALRRTGGVPGPRRAPAAAASTVEMGRETTALLTRLNRQVTVLTERAEAPTTHAETNEAGRADVERVLRTLTEQRAHLDEQLAVLRAEVAHAATRPVPGQDSAQA